MNKIIGLLISCILLVSSVVVGTAFTYDINEYERPSEMYRLINEEREEEGIPKLIYSDDLEKAAKVRAVEIVSLYSDDRPNGNKFSTVLDDKGISYELCEENIGTNTVSAAHMIDIWMLYEDCKNNILSSDFTSMGAAMVNDNGAKYWVVIFCSGLGESNIIVDENKPIETSPPHKDDDLPVHIDDGDDVVGVELPSLGNVFTDVKEGAWYYDYVKYVYSRGIMVGTGTNTFGVNTPLTRAMLVTVLYKIEGSPTVIGSIPFTDVKGGSWYEKAVNWAYNNGITSGISKISFGPNNKITREQLVTLMYKYAQYKNIDTLVPSDISTFADYNSISSWAIIAMIWANGSGLVSGVGNNMLDPKGSATRAQVATILYKYLNL